MLDGEPPEIRFEPLWVAAQVAAWLGDYDEFERWAKAALAAAREAERKDLEALVIHGARRSRTCSGSSSPRPRRSSLRALELADESGSLFSRASALARARLDSSSSASDPSRPKRTFAAARELFAELGNTTREAVMTMMIGRAAFAQGDARARREAACATPCGC